MSEQQVPSDGRQAFPMPLSLAGSRLLKRLWKQANAFIDKCFACVFAVALAVATIGAGCASGYLFCVAIEAVLVGTWTSAALLTGFAFVIASNVFRTCVTLSTLAQRDKREGVTAMAIEGRDKCACCGKPIRSVEDLSNDN